MKFKRWTLLLCLLLCVTTGVSADLSSLDAALSPLINGGGAVNVSVTMAVKTLLPFDELRLDLINRVLSRVTLDAQVDPSTDTQVTSFQLALSYNDLFSFTEQNKGGAYLLQTSLLPNRMLFSTQASPINTLLMPAAEETTEPEEDMGLNTSDVEEAFDMLTAVDALEDCYPALINKTVPLTEKNTPNYYIENIGRGRISYVAKLTTEQSGELLSELRAVLSCGMDTAYREELAQITFARGFTVALYQNEGGEDICVYIKGTILYPDGDRRTLKWQWAFTPDRETQTFLLEVSRESGTRDSRVIHSILTRTGGDTGFTLEEETSVNLRRGGLNETSTLTTDLSAGGDPLTCTGSVTRVTRATLGGESEGETETDVTVDLSLAEIGGGSQLSGTAVYRALKDDTVQTELELTFAPPVIAAAAVASDTDVPANTPSVEISILPAESDAVQQTAETAAPAVTATAAATEPPEFLVGTPPLGLSDYKIPSEMITVNLDSTDSQTVQSLMGEAAQRLAGNLILAILDLPAEDRELLSDGMTESDYAIFLALLD